MHGVAAPNPLPPGPAPQAPSNPPMALATNQQIAATQPRSMPPPPPPPPQAPGYLNVPRTYGPPQQSQPTDAYNAGLQYTNASLQNTAPTPYKGAWPPPDVIQYPGSAHDDMPVVVPARVATSSDPVFVLSHVCSVCGRMRSAGYHRHHPIVPGQPTVQTPCRKCKKKSKKKRAEKETKDNTTITIRIDDSSMRGRGRDRDEVRYVRSYSSPSPPRRSVVRSSSHANIGLRVLQGEQTSRRKSRVRTRYVSPSPPPEIRGRYRAPGSYPSPDPPAYEHRVRYVESSLSPPPLRRTTRVEYREESLERPVTDYRPCSLSPIRVSRRGYRNDDAAEARISSHPTAFRTVVPERRSNMRGSEASASTDSPSHDLSPRRGILRNTTMDFETGQRRRMRESHDSMLPEVEHNRVRFVADRSRREGREEPDADLDYSAPRSRYADEHLDNYLHHTEREYVSISRSPSPLTRGFERLNIRRSSPPPSRDYDFNAHVQYISPNDHRMEARYRHVSPPRGRDTRSRAPSPPFPSSRLDYHTHPRGDERPALDPRHEDWDDVTDTASEQSDDVVRYSSFREIDENGRPCTIVEERRTRKVSDTGRGAEELPRSFPGAPALTRSYRVV